MTGSNAGNESLIKIVMSTKLGKKSGIGTDHSNYIDYRTGPGKFFFVFGPFFLALQNSPIGLMKIIMDWELILGLDIDRINIGRANVEGIDIGIYRVYGYIVEVRSTRSFFIQSGALSVCP